MAKNPKDGKLLYHLTALDNLLSIFEKGLLPRNNINFKFKDVADDEILKDRKKFALGDHTPFHFFCPSPFAGAAQNANLDTEFVYITVSRELAEYHKFKIIPSHPLHFHEEPLEWGEGIEKIDWELMSRRDYSNHLCKETCMAESLFNGHIKIEHFHTIFVRNGEVQSNVLNLLKEMELKVRVTINASMFIKK